jgi:DNA-binding Lrp family transcriptional regulator
MADMYVLVVCDLGRTEAIASELQDIDELDEVHMLYGVYDIIVKMSGTIPKEMEYLTSKIRHIDGIKTTSTLIGYTKDGF